MVFKTVCTATSGLFNPLVRCCQTDSYQSQFAAEYMNLCGTKLAPFGESSASGQLEILSLVEVAWFRPFDDAIKALTPRCDLRSPKPVHFDWYVVILAKR